MNILEVFVQLRDDLKTWVTKNLEFLNNKINNIQGFSGDYNDLVNAPNITEDDSGNMIVTDEVGNIIFKADSEGMHTTALSLNGESIIDIIDEKVASVVDAAPETLNTLNELSAALNDDENFATTVTTEIGKKVDKVEGKGLSTNDFTDEYKEKLDDLENITFEETDPTVPAWAKEANKPSYTAEEIGLGNVDNTADLDKPVSTATQNTIDALKKELSESTVSENSEWKIVDASGNIIAQIDANGLETTAVNAQVMKVNGVDVQPVIPVTTSDNGKFLRVVDGAWTAASVPNAEEATF